MKTESIFIPTSHISNCDCEIAKTKLMKDDHLIIGILEEWKKSIQFFLILKFLICQQFSSFFFE